MIQASSKRVTLDEFIRLLAVKINVIHRIDISDWV
jgi:hypothetical protein